jgi:xyloglucan fucosyltransferase
MYYEHATVTGEHVSVLQPPAGAENQPQNHKALVEMFLQSYCDVSVVSGWSTVGYVGHGLAGLSPWLLLPPTNQTVAHPPCVRAMSVLPRAAELWLQGQDKRRPMLTCLMQLVVHSFSRCLARF